jgi:hypothetical protein
VKDCGLLVSTLVQGDARHAVNQMGRKVLRHGMSCQDGIQRGGLKLILYVLDRLYGAAEQDTREDRQLAEPALQQQLEQEQSAGTQSLKGKQDLRNASVETDRQEVQSRISSQKSRGGGLRRSQMRPLQAEPGGKYANGHLQRL